MTCRLVIAMTGFWGGRYERSFVDVRIFKSGFSRGSVVSSGGFFVLLCDQLLCLHLS